MDTFEGLPGITSVGKGSQAPTPTPTRAPTGDNSMFLSKQRVIEILKGAPKGTNPAGIIAALRDKGYTLEGYDEAGKTSAQTQSDGGLIGKIGSFIKNNVFGAPLPQEMIGVAKSVGDTAVGTVQLGQKIANKAADVTGLPIKSTPIQSPEFLKASNQDQEIGKIAGEVAQFFIPGPAETKAALTLDKLVDSAKFAETFGPKAGKALEGILKVIGHGATMGGSTAGVTALQTGGDVEKTEGAGVLGFLGGASGKVLESVAPGISKVLERANFRMTGAKATKLGEKADRAAEFMAKDSYIGTPNMKFNKLTKQTNSFESAIQSSIPKDTTVPKEEVITNLKSIVDKFKGQPAKYSKVKSDVQHAIDVLNETNPSKEISLESLLNSKRSYGGAAFSKDGTAMLNDSKYAIESAFYDTLSNKLTSLSPDGAIKVPKDLQKFFDGKTEVPLKEFNAQYGNAITSRNLMNIARNKKDVDFVTRIIVDMAGEALGGPAGALAADVISTKGMTAARSALGAGIQKSGSTVPFITKAGLGYENEQGK